MFPSTLSTFNRPTPTDRLNSPSHSALHNTVSSALGQVEAVLGIRGDSSVVGTINTAVFSPGSDGGGHVQSANKGGTGQTSYIKGDMLVAQSTSVLSKLSTGANDTVLIADSSTSVGVKWGTFTATNVQSFLAGGTWTKPGNATVSSKVMVEIWGGGGSGSSGGGNQEAGGGGGGAYNSGVFIASLLGATETVSIGAGGASVAGTVGIVGGNTVFGTTVSLLSAFGGGGGGVGSSGASGGGGGGIFSAGATGSTEVGGAGGSFGWSGASSLFAGGGGTGSAGAATINAINTTGGASNGASAGNCIYGGAGGGGAQSSLFGTGGFSSFGGRGGNGGVSSGLAGSIPGGGGGGASNTSPSGPGGGGKAVITTFL